MRGSLPACARIPSTCSGGHQVFTENATTRRTDGRPAATSSATMPPIECPISTTSRPAGTIAETACACAAKSYAGAHGDLP